MAAIAELEVHNAAHQPRNKDMLQHSAAHALKLLQGSMGSTGFSGLAVLVSAAEAALKAGDHPLCRQCLQTYFAEADRYHGPQAKAEARDQLMCRALFATGQLVSQLSSRLKGQALIDGVLESMRYIMQGVELATSSPRYHYLIYNGSVHYWHAARPLQCEHLRQHLLPSLDKLCQALEKVEGQAAWRARQLMALGLCQAETLKPDDALKTLAKAADLAAAAGAMVLKHEVSALQTHIQSLQAAKLSGGKPPAAAPVGKGPAAAGAGGGGGKSSAPALAAAARRKSGELATLHGKLDEAGALSILQWVLSSKPDAAAAEQQLRAAWKMVDPNPDGTSRHALLRVVARLGWAAALANNTQLAEQLAKRAAASPDLGPRVWSDITRLLLALRSAEAVTLTPGSSAGYGSCCNAEAVRARMKILDGIDEAVTAFVKLHDVDGVHYCAKLAWNAGLPLLQQCHRHLLKPCFAAVAKALEATSSPLTKLRAAFHLEVAKAEADDESYTKAAKEISLALSLDYPASSEAALTWGYEREVDRFLQPLARASRLRAGGGADGAEAACAGADDDAVMLVERARESKSAAIRGDYLQKAVDKLALLLAVKLPATVSSEAVLDPAAAAARADQLQKARARTELWAEIVLLAWVPCELEGLVRVAAPYVLATNWQDTGDKEMMLLQARVALIEADACRLALKKLALEFVPPAGYNAQQHLPLSSTSDSTTDHDEKDPGPGAADVGEDGVRLASVTDEQLQRLMVEDWIHGMLLAVSAGQPWLLMNCALAAWNVYLPLMHKQRYAELAGVALPLLKQLLQESGPLDSNLCVMLAEAAAKAAEHVALLQVLQPAAATQGSGQDDEEDESEEDVVAKLWSFRTGGTSWFVSLTDARAKTVDMDIAKLLQAGQHPANKVLLQLLSDTADACQAALAKATTAAEPQGLIQAYARLQQLQGKPTATPAGAPASMAVTSKVLGLIEGLNAASAAANNPASGGGTTVGKPQDKAPASVGKLQDKAGAVAAPIVNKAEQDIISAMQLLASAPVVNLELWAQLARAAGHHGHWQLAKECATAALGSLPADKRDLQSVTAASDVLEVSPQGWYWLSVAEMLQGQAILSLLGMGSQDAGNKLSLQHKALTHFATAAKLASFISRADLTEAAARLAWNACVANGTAGLMAAGLTKAAVVPQLKVVVGALNATRPADPRFQVSCNVLLLECLTAAGQWAAARQHVEALQRCLPLKSHGPVADAAVEVAGWRARCLARAPLSDRMMEDMNRLLSELSTPQAKAHAWLAFGQACGSLSGQLTARKAALTALNGLPLEQIEYEMEFAEWLVATGCEGATAGISADVLLRTAINTLKELQAAAAVHGDDVSVIDACDTASERTKTSKHTHSSGQTAASPRRTTVQDPAARRRTATDVMGNTKGAARRVTKTAATSGTGQLRDDEMQHGGLSGKQMGQLLRAYMLMSQVAPLAAERESGLISAQQHALRMLTQTLLAAGATASAPTTSGPPQQQVDLSTDSTTASTDSAANAAASTSVDESTVVDSTATGSQCSQVPSLVESTKASEVFPGSLDLLGWADWDPSAELISQLRQLARVTCPSNTNSTSTSSSVHGSSAGAHNGAVAPSADTLAECLLNPACMCAPGLLLANLQLLSDELQSAGQHVLALPVLQLARLVAAVTLDNQAMTAVYTLELSSLCEFLGLTTEASMWLAAAAPESWPTQQQLQQAEQLVAAQQLVQQVLQHAAQSHESSSTSGAAVTASAHLSPVGFLSAALQQAEPNLAQSWLRCATSSTRHTYDAGATEETDNSTAANRSSTQTPSTVLQGTLRPRSASRLTASSCSMAGKQSITASAACRATERGMVSSATGDCVVTAAQDAVPFGTLQWLKPISLQDSWVGVAKYLTAHGQYTAAMRLCTAAMELARAVDDQDTQATVHLLDARLAALAQQRDTAIEHIQAAQKIGGSVKFWRDSLLLYADMRGDMRSGGVRDARAALEGGVSMLESVARSHSTVAHAAISAACECKLQLAQLLAQQAQQQLQEGETDAALLMHSRAVTLTRIAVDELQSVGAQVLRVNALLQLAELMAQDPERKLRQQQHVAQQQMLQSSSQDGLDKPILPLDERLLLLEIRQVLQDAEQETLDRHQQQRRLIDHQPYDQLHSNTTQTTSESAAGTTLAANHTAATNHMLTVTTPISRLLSSVQLKLADLELKLSQLSLQYTAIDQSVDQLVFPVVEGRDPQVVIDYLEQCRQQANTGGGDDSNKGGVDGMAYHQHAAHHAAAAAERAAQHVPAQHAAALLSTGRALMQQAHAAMIAEHLVTLNRTGAGAVAAFEADAAWAPWPRSLQHQQQQGMQLLGRSPWSSTAGSSGSSQQQQQEQQQFDVPLLDINATVSVMLSQCGQSNIRGAVSGTGTLSASGAVSATSSPRTSAAVSASTSGAGSVQGNAYASVAGSTAAVPAAVAVPQPLPIPSAAEPALNSAVQQLQLALAEALTVQDLHTARAAALELMRCYGQLQPQLAAECLAVAQSCYAAAEMKDVFIRCASDHHGEVLTWRQLQQLQQASSCVLPEHLYIQQARQLLSITGVADKRLQVQAAVATGSAFAPLLAQLQPEQRLLLLHYDDSTEELLCAAWNVEADPAAAAGTGSSSSNGASGNASITTSSTGGSVMSSSGPGFSESGGTKPAAAAGAGAKRDSLAAAAAAAVPRIVIIGSMHLPLQKLNCLVGEFKSYKRQLHKKIVEVTSKPPANSTPAAAAAAAAAVLTSSPSRSLKTTAAAAATTAATPAPAAAAVSAAKAAAGKDKGPKDEGQTTNAAAAAAWMPTESVFPVELNHQWQQLKQQFAMLLEPLSGMLLRALSTAATAAAATEATAKAAATGGSKARPQSAAGKAAKASSAAAKITSHHHQQQQQQQQQLWLTVQLLLDPMLCALPWEALPYLSSTCSSITRCFSMVQLAGLTFGYDAAAAAGANAAAAAVVDVHKLTYLVDVDHHMSSQMGCYSPPLIPQFRHQLLDVCGREWQGLMGVSGQQPAQQQLIKMVAGSRGGLLIMGPGRLLGHMLTTQAVADLDMSNCTAALIFDRLASEDSAAHHLKVDNKKYADERVLEGPTHTAMLLMLRGVRSVALAAITGMPHTHLQLADAILKSMSSSSGGSSSHNAKSMSLSEAVWDAKRNVLRDFELVAVRDCGMIVYGVGSVVGGDADSKQRTAGAGKK